MSQSDAQRIGICLNDYEQFWWRADDGQPTCPVCSLEDEEYQAQHRFFVAEESRRQAIDALRRIKANAVSWHGPHSSLDGHAQALAVIAEWCDAALVKLGENP